MTKKDEKDETKKETENPGRGFSGLQNSFGVTKFGVTKFGVKQIGLKKRESFSEQVLRKKSLKGRVPKRRFQNE